jgi:hypothetical protein
MDETLLEAGVLGYIQVAGRR